MPRANNYKNLTESARKKKVSGNHLVNTSGQVGLAKTTKNEEIWVKVIFAVRSF